ncbi:MAG TPA: TCR/Tet family MFS transporter [Caulobacteraceae bacterium]|jgi:DHA1 family tetracycline resistance protein-like MFS transporter
MIDTTGATAAAAGRKPRAAALGFIFATALMDVIALGIIIPVLPNLIKEMAGGSTAQALHYVLIFSTTWAVMQFFASPIVGSLSDHFGRRPVLLISIFGLGCDYVIMATAPNLSVLYIGRLISGITAASFSTAGAYIADITPPEKRAQNFGLIGAAFGVGFVIGPALAGLLGQFSPRLPFWFAAGLAMVNWLFGLFVLPESLPKERRAAFSWRKANPVGSLQLLAAHPGMLGMAAMFFLYMLAHQSLQQIFVLFTGYRFGWGIRDVGLFLGATGVASIIVQMMLVRPIVKAMGERRAMLVGLLCGVFGFAIYALAPTSLLFWCGLPVFAMIGLVQPTSQSLMSRRVPGNEQGRLQGAMSGIQSITGLIGPSLYTTVFAWAITSGKPLGVPGLGILVAAGLAFFALLLAVRYARAPSTSAA